jgi:hypothetical protein
VVPSIFGGKRQPSAYFTAQYFGIMRTTLTNFYRPTPTPDTHEALDADREYIFIFLKNYSNLLEFTK